MLLCEQLKSSSVRLDVSEEVVWVQGEVGAQAEVGAQGEIVKRRFGGESKDTGMFSQESQSGGSAFCALTRFRCEKPGMLSLFWSLLPQVR